MITYSENKFANFITRALPVRLEQLWPRLHLLRPGPHLTNQGLEMVVQMKPSRANRRGLLITGVRSVCFELRSLRSLSV
ncbi:hypothetical protein Bpfe_023847 [Biomphalaria pfeifferi]|uniref:Uncharacterized protein n=1 Tax=Biomphalaria pfeifferi TaxID=112525 RepID=A0AAD8B385_BIOPF|nr:hypothetical protein Bpfe_023847 [Biomphalaria pfeifferi]